MPVCGYRVGYLGLAWPSFRPKSGSKSKISGRVLLAQPSDVVVLFAGFWRWGEVGWSGVAERHAMSPTLVPAVTKDAFYFYLCCPLPGEGPDGHFPANIGSSGPVSAQNRG